MVACNLLPTRCLHLNSVLSSSDRVSDQASPFRYTPQQNYTFFNPADATSATATAVTVITAGVGNILCQGNDACLVDYTVSADLANSTKITGLRLWNISNIAGEGRSCQTRDFLCYLCSVAMSARFSLTFACGCCTWRFAAGAFPAFIAVPLYATEKTVLAHDAFHQIPAVLLLLAFFHSLSPDSINAEMCVVPACL